MTLRTFLKNTLIGRLSVYTFSVALLLPALLLAPVPVTYAQQATVLEEVIVTAQKREERLQDASISITALSSDQLENLGVRGLGDLIEGAIPFLKVLPYPNSPATLNLSMRGTSAADAGSTFTELPVGIYVDGVYLGRAQGAGLDIVDIERIEVLRGPQGTLYGRNSVGGAVNIVSKKPSGEFSFKQTANGGSKFSQWDATTHLDLPAWNWFGGEMRARFSYLRANDNGWLENSRTSEFDDNENYFSENKEAFRSVFTWDWDTVSLNYTVDLSDNQISQAYFQLEEGNSVGIGNARANNYNTAPVLRDGRSVGTACTAPDTLSNRMGTGLRNVLDTAGADAADVDSYLTAEIALYTGCTQAAYSFLGDLTTYIPGSVGRQESVSDGRFGVQNIPADIDTVGHSFTATWQALDSLEIKFITSFREVEQLAGFNYAGAFGVGLTNIGGRGNIDQEQFSQEFQFLGNFLDGKVEYVAGLYLYDEKVRERGSHNRQGFLTANPANIAANARYLADYPIIQQLAVNFGGLTGSVNGLNEILDALEARDFSASPDIESNIAMLRAALDPTSNPLDFSPLRPLGNIAALPLLDANGLPEVIDTPLPLIGADTATNPRFANIVNAEVQSIAIYAQFDYHLSDAIDLTFGVRYTDDSRDAIRAFDLRPLAENTGNSNRPVNCLSAAGTITEACIVERNVDSDNVDYNLVLSYDLNDDVNLFWRYATGYKSAGVDRRSLDFVTFTDETLDSIEWGVKTSFNENRGRWSAAVFQSNYRDKQNTFNDPTPGAQVTDTLTVNAKGVIKIGGFESELSFLAADGLTIGINYAYLDWTYPQQDQIIVDTLNVPNVFDPRAPRSVSTVLDNGIRGVQSAPRHSGSLTLDYTFPTYAFGELSLHFDWNSSTGFFYSPRHLFRTDARDVMNARLSLAQIPLDFRGNLTVSLWGTNLTDEEYVIYSINNLQSGNTSSAYGQPRTSGLEIVYEY